MALGYISVDSPFATSVEFLLSFIFVLLSFILLVGSVLSGCNSLAEHLCLVFVAISTSYCANSPPRGDYVGEDKRHLTAYARNLFSYTV